MSDHAPKPQLPPPPTTPPPPNRTTPPPPTPATTPPASWTRHARQRLPGRAVTRRPRLIYIDRHQVNTYPA
ncbi:MAG: hypothetical protein R2851_27390 [Caldilineaceae bacterium]